MKKSAKLLLFLAAVGIVLMFAPIARAEFGFTPSVTIREEYNDNIFLTPSNEVGDFITSVYPAVNFTYKSEYIDLFLDYGFIFRFYAKHSDLNETSLNTTQRARLDTTLNPIKDTLYIKIFDAYQRVPIDQRRQVAIDNVIVNVTDSNNFLVNPYIVYPLSGTLSTKVGYIYQNLWYKSEEGDNTENQTAEASLTKEFSEKFSATLSYTHLFHRPQKTEQYDSQNGSLSIVYRVSTKFSLNGSVGETWFKYKVRDDQKSTVWQAQANYLLTDVTTLSAGYSENFADSVNQGTYKNKRIFGNYSYNGPVPTTFSVFRNEAKYITTNREDRSLGSTLSIGLPVTAALTPRLTAVYTHFDFMPEGEKADRYGASVALDYAFKITTLTLGYTYNKNDSNNNNNDYTNNIIWAQARFSY